MTAGTSTVSTAITTTAISDSGDAGIGSNSACRVLMIYPKSVPDSFWNYVPTCELVGAKYPAARAQPRTVYA